MNSAPGNLQRVASEIIDMKPKDRVQHNMIEKEIGNNGTTRRAYKIKNLDKVIKIAVTEGAINENYEEMQVWMKVKSTPDRDFFCPIRHKAKSNEWLIMDFAQPIRDANGFWISEIKQEIFSRKIKKFIDQYYDISTDNLGKHKNLGTVIFDYPWGSHIQEYDLYH
jgi:hypothetical protein